MGEVVKLTQLSVDPSNFKLAGAVTDDAGAYMKSGLYIDPNTGKYVLKKEYEIANDEEQTKFIRDISYLAYCEHPLIAKLVGYAFFNEKGEPGNFTMFTEYPDHGLLMDFLNKGDVEFDSTAKSKFIFGAAIIGSFLHSRNIIHRCFAPPSFGINKDLEPVLLNLGTSKSGLLKINATIQFNDTNWNAPELDDSDIELDPKYYYSADVFSFGTMIYYLYTGDVPFESKRFMEIKRLKENRKIPDDMPEGMNEILSVCWSTDPSSRPPFSEILLRLQSHIGLFPDTNLAEFDEYVKKVLMVPISSPICSIAPPELTQSVHVIYASVMTNYKLKYDPKILNALYTIREQVDSYVPIIIQVVRAGCCPPIIDKIPSFMFIAALNGEINKLFGLPDVYQKIVAISKNEEKLIDSPYLTMEQIGITNGTVLHVYNAFGNKTLKSDILKLDIPFIGKVPIAYMPEDTVEILKKDIHFLTRIPYNQFKLEFKRVELNERSSDQLQEIGINKNDTVTVVTTFKNDSFQIKVDMSGVIGRDGVNDTNVTPITKIEDIMNGANVNSHNCFVTYKGKELAKHKALIDYEIKKGETLEINTSVVITD